MYIKVQSTPYLSMYQVNHVFAVSALLSLKKVPSFCQSVGYKKIKRQGKKDREEHPYHSNKLTKQSHYLICCFFYTHRFLSHVKTLTQFT